MKFNLSIITRFSWSCEFLQKQLVYLFGDLFKITCHSVNSKPVKPIYNADLILLHEPSALVEMQKYIKSDCPLILMRRTITSEAVGKLKEIPDGIRAVVVNATDYMAHETMTNIYQLGIKNIELVPWAPDSNRPFPVVDYVLTHRIYDFLPETGKPTVILGSRVINADVIMDVLSYFNVDFEMIDAVFSRYISIVPSYVKGVHSLLENNRFLSAQWNLLYDKINQSVAIISSDNHITSFNSHFSKLIEPLRLDNQIIKMDELVQLNPHLGFLRINGEVENEIVEVNGNKLIMSVDYLDAENMNLGRIVRLEPYSQIVSTHQNVHKKIVGDGHIAKYGFEDIIGESGIIKGVKSLGRKFAKSNMPVLIYGESGTGKELMSSAIHNESYRSNAPFIAVNCAGIPDALLESEFFGYEGSAFTGAKKSGAIGLFEKAHGGTLFLDEISELPFALQGKLLRAIQEKEIRKVGSTQTITVDVRVIAASNKNLEKMIEQGVFRKDLYYRLNVFSLTLPPLRERVGDIKLLCKQFIKQRNRLGSEDFYKFIESYDWPGNIRELKNVIEYMSVVCDEEFEIKCLPTYIKEKGIVRKLFDSKPEYDNDLLILKAIDECKKQGQGTGRRSLSTYISTHYYFISEAEVRKHLHSLAGQGLIIVSKGRTGCSLTGDGMEQLKVNKDKI